MATAGKNMKGFFRQKKSNVTGGISKSKSSSCKVSSKHIATQAFDVTSPAAVISRDSVGLNDDKDKNEEILRQFDMNMAYGPCLGMTRMARWERAMRLGMNPSKEIESLLMNEKVQQECLWHCLI